jgi:tRNA A-37 threonylcarbamoyl transferase component Bud32
MKLFELYAELGLDASKFDKGVKAASKQGASLANSVSGGLQAVSAKTIAMGHALYDFTKMAARTAGNLVKDVVNSFAEYEQLEGGVNKLFGDSAGMVIDNAQRAYSTAGMSMNEYMQTVTSFSASLISSLKGDTVAAANVADMALQDMSDNASTFGTDMASIENAYQGFSKQNYTMLDNLKLGYGGTRSEMQRLLKDAQRIKRAQGENVRYSINNLADVYEAIHVIQQEMGITGTTAEEAAKTISGSYHATMAAWSNILTGLGTEQEMGELIGNFVDSGSNLVKNVMQLVPKVGKAVFQEAVPVISGYLGQLGPKALDAGANLLANVLKGLTGDTSSQEEIKAFISGVWSDAQTGLDGLISAGGGLLKGIYNSLISDGDSKTGIVAEISGIWDSASESMDALVDAAGGLLGTIYTGITGQKATAENIGNTIGGVFNAGGQAIDDVLNRATTFFSELDEKLGDPDASIGEKIAGVFVTGSDAMMGLLHDAGSFMSNLYAAVTGDTEGAAKMQGWIDDLFKTSAEIEAENAADKKSAQYAVKYDQNTVQSMMNAASSMYANPSMYGITEAIADEWISRLAAGGLGFDEYKEIADGIGAALKYAMEHEESRDEEGGETSINLQVNVSVDGQEVSAIIEPMVTESVTGSIGRQFKLANLVTA